MHHLLLVLNFFFFLELDTFNVPLVIYIPPPYVPVAFLLSIDDSRCYISSSKTHFSSITTSSITINSSLLTINDCSIISAAYVYNPPPKKPNF